MTALVELLCRILVGMVCRVVDLMFFVHQMPNFNTGDSNIGREAMKRVIVSVGHHGEVCTGRINFKMCRLSTLQTEKVITE